MKALNFDTGINEYDLGGKLTVRLAALTRLTQDSARSMPSQVMIQPSRTGVPSV